MNVGGGALSVDKRTLATLLKDFPKTFGLTETAKGYFPHKFNTDEDQNYIGLYPDKQFYGYEEMKKIDKEKFDEWYETTNNKTFNFEKEMYKYCNSDVDILRRGCTKLRELFMQIAHIDPFQYITIASVCQAIYRNEFLPENTIGVCSETPADNRQLLNKVNKVVEICFTKTKHQARL